MGKMLFPSSRHASSWNTASIFGVQSFETPPVFRKLNTIYTSSRKMVSLNVGYHNLMREFRCPSALRRIHLTENAEDLISHGVITKDGFDASGSLITDMRQAFDDRFSNPLETTSERFVWDYWHVPSQYSLMRTPADAFFPDDLYQQLESQILDFGCRELGCRSISPIWLSYYVHGHRQEFHTDAPHGPLAFVLSLTDFEQRKFSGGETMLLKDRILNFWKTHGEKSIELHDILELVEPRFNRMTVFDPRIPHGVRMVEGVSDPREGRIVLHGWYTEPSAYFEGAIDEELATEILNTSLSSLYQSLSQLPEATGILNSRLDIRSDGSVEQICILANTLQFRNQEIDRYSGIDAIIECIYDHLSGVSFAPAMQSSSPAEIVVPFLFD